MSSKIRQGFVSNSSSSSFIIKREYLTPNQIKAIKKHIAYSDLMEWSCGYIDDAWIITETESSIVGSTSMNNFDMHYFLEKLGVDINNVEWS